MSSVASTTSGKRSRDKPGKEPEEADKRSKIVVADLLDTLPPTEVCQNCQSPPPLLPNFHPCCIHPASSFTTSYMLQMNREFFPNLTGKGPPKSITTRHWADITSQKFLKALSNRWWIRMGGQCYSSTIGWALINSMSKTTPRGTTQDICCREGRPHMTPKEFNEKYLLKEEKKPARTQ